MKCKKCEHLLFKIHVIPCCDNCSENAAWNENQEEYTYDEKIILEKELIRDHVAEEGECAFGSASGSGCYMFICASCGNKTNLAILEC